MEETEQILEEYEMILNHPSIDYDEIVKEMLSKPKRVCIHKIYSTLLGLSGWKGILNIDAVEEYEFVETILSNIDSCLTANYKDYPLLTKPKTTLKLISQFSIALADQLFNKDQEVVDQINYFLLKMSRMSLRATRHTATVIAMKFITSLLTNFDDSKRVYDALYHKHEAKKNNRVYNQKRLLQMEQDMTNIERKRESLNQYLMFYIKQIYLQRYNDTVNTIKNVCLSEFLNEWLKINIFKAFIRNNENANARNTKGQLSDLVNGLIYILTYKDTNQDNQVLVLKILEKIMELDLERIKRFYELYHMQLFNMVIKNKNPKSILHLLKFFVLLKRGFILSYDKKQLTTLYVYIYSTTFEISQMAAQLFTITYLFNPNVGSTSNSDGSIGSQVIFNSLETIDKIKAVLHFIEVDMKNCDQKKPKGQPLSHNYDKVFVNGIFHHWPELKDWDYFIGLIQKYELSRDFELRLFSIWACAIEFYISPQQLISLQKNQNMEEEDGRRKEVTDEIFNKILEMVEVYKEDHCVLFFILKILNMMDFEKFLMYPEMADKLIKSTTDYFMLSYNEQFINEFAIFAQNMFECVKQMLPHLYAHSDLLLSQLYLRITQINLENVQNTDEFSISLLKWACLTKHSKVLMEQIYQKNQFFIDIITTDKFKQQFKYKTKLFDIIVDEMDWHKNNLLNEWYIDDATDTDERNSNYVEKVERILKKVKRAFVDLFNSNFNQPQLHLKIFGSLLDLFEMFDKKSNEILVSKGVQLPLPERCIFNPTNDNNPIIIESLLEFASLLLIKTPNEEEEIKLRNQYLEKIFKLVLSGFIDYKKFSWKLLQYYAKIDANYESTFDKFLKLFFTHAPKSFHKMIFITFATKFKQLLINDSRGKQKLDISQRSFINLKENMEKFKNFLAKNGRYQDRSKIVRDEIFIAAVNLLIETNNIKYKVFLDSLKKCFIKYLEPKDIQYIKNWFQQLVAEKTITNELSTLLTNIFVQKNQQ